mgnify:CR=1 FL=1
MSESSEPYIVKKQNEPDRVEWAVEAIRSKLAEQIRSGHQVKVVLWFDHKLMQARLEWYVLE